MEEARYLVSRFFPPIGRGITTTYALTALSLVPFDLWPAATLRLAQGQHVYGGFSRASHACHASRKHSQRVSERC